MAGRRNDNPQAKIIVRHYPPDTSDQDLRIMFEKYGKIDDLFSPPDKITKKSRGFTFVQYRRIEDASEAVRGMSGRDISGHKLNVEFARIPRPVDRGGSDRDRGRDRRARSRSPRDRRRSPIRDRDHGRDSYRDSHRGGMRGGDYYDSPGGLSHPYSAIPGPGGYQGPPPGPLGGGMRRGLLDPPGPPPIQSPYGSRDHPPMGQSSRGGYGGAPPPDDIGGYGRGPPPSSEPRGLPPERDSYGGPPPPRGGYSGSGGPPPDQYGPSRGYYDDQRYGSEAPSRPGPGSSSDGGSYGPSPSWGGGSGGGGGGYGGSYDRRGYDSYQSGPPSQDSYSQYGSRDSYGATSTGTGQSSGGYGPPPSSSNRYSSLPSNPNYPSQGLGKSDHGLDTQRGSSGGYAANRDPYQYGNNNGSSAPQGYSSISTGPSLSKLSGDRYGSGYTASTYGRQGGGASASSGRDSSYGSGRGGYDPTSGRGAYDQPSARGNVYDRSGYSTTDRSGIGLGPKPTSYGASPPVQGRGGGSGSGAYGAVQPTGGGYGPPPSQERRGLAPGGYSYGQPRY